MARSFVNDILGDMPSQSRVVVCGDFNTRVGNMAPCVRDVILTRQSVDVVKCTRASWFIDICST